MASVTDSNSILAHDSQGAHDDFQQDYGSDPENIQSFLVVTGLPMMHVNARSHVLVQWLRRRVGDAHLRLGYRPIIMPHDTNGSSKGNAFIACKSAEDASTVIGILDGYIMDRNHTLSARRIRPE